MVYSCKPTLSAIVYLGGILPALQELFSTRDGTRVCRRIRTSPGAQKGAPGMNEGYMDGNIIGQSNSIFM